MGRRGFKLNSPGRCLLIYLVIAALLTRTVFGSDHLYEVLLESLGFLAAIPVGAFLSFYFGIVQARILGLIYRTTSDELGWFQH